MAPTLSRTDHLTFQLRGPEHRRPPEQPSPSLLSASTFRQASASGWPDRSGSTWKEDLGADSTEAWQPRFQAPRPVGRGAWQPPTRQVPSDRKARLWAGTPSSCSARASDSLATVFVPQMLMRLTGARRFDEGLCRSPLPGHGGDPHKGTASWTVGPASGGLCGVRVCPRHPVWEPGQRVQGDPHEGGQEKETRSPLRNNLYSTYAKLFMLTVCHGYAAPVSNAAARPL